MANNSKRRGFNPVLAFILGFLFGIIVLIGSVAGAVFIALNYKLDKLEFNKDEDGKYIYINADPENGGVGTVLDLIKKAAELAGSASELSLGEVEELLPVTSSLADTVTDALEKYVEIDSEEFKRVKFGEIGEYLGDKVMEVRPAALLEQFGISVSDNKLMEIVMYGKEADYVENQSVKIPVYYDTYIFNGDGYTRKTDALPLSAGFESLLAEKGEEYRLYFYSYDVARASGCYVTFKNEDGSFVFIPEEEYAYTFNNDTATLSGNYYYEGENKVEVNPVTLGSLSDGSALSALDEVPVTDFIDGEGNLTDKILGDVTVGDLINGNVDLEQIIDDLTLADFVDVTLTYQEGELAPTASDSVLAYVAFGVTDITEKDGIVKGVYHPTEGEKQACTLTIKEGKISKVNLSENGEEISGTTVKNVSERFSGVTKDLKIGSLMDVEDNKILNAIKNSTIESLPADIDNLSINELYAEEIYRKKDKDGNVIYEAELKVATEYKDEYLYYAEEDGAYVLVERAYIRENFEAGRFYTYGEAQGAWKLLLYNKEKNDDRKTEQAYSVNRIGELMTNVTNNTQDTSLRELTEAGMLQLSEDQLNTRYDENRRVGELALHEAIDLFVYILNNPLKPGQN